jgi:hypothetical protein
LSSDSSAADNSQSTQPVPMDMSISLETPSRRTQSYSDHAGSSGVTGVGNTTGSMALSLGSSGPLQSQLSGSSGVTEYSVTGESPVRPGIRSDSLPSSSTLGSQGAMSAAPSLPESSPITPPGYGISGSSLSQTDSSYPENASSSEIGSLDLSRVESRSLDLSSGRSSDAPSSQVPSSSQAPDVPLSMDTDGSLDLSKSAAALTTLQQVPARPPTATANTR